MFNSFTSFFVFIYKSIFGFIPTFINYIKVNQFSIYNEGSFPSSSFKHIFTTCVLSRLNLLPYDLTILLDELIFKIGIPICLIVPICTLSDLCRIKTGSLNRISIVSIPFLQDDIKLNINLDEKHLKDSFLAVQAFMVANKISKSHTTTIFDLYEDLS